MLGTKYRGRRRGIAVREGSVEQARREAKLTLAQVAGGTLTRTAIHLIEKGRTRPSIETLQQIARQTRKPIEFFLTPDSPPALTESQTKLRELERLTAVRELRKVVEMGIALLADEWSPEDRALVHFCVGQAYCRLVQPVESLQHLRPAREAFERLGDEWMTVETLDWESSALGLLDDSDALPLANQALERCRVLNPKAPQIEARILGHIAAMYLVAHANGAAIRYYDAAASAAAGVKDLLQLAKMHHGLGLAYHRQQQPAAARQHYDKAITLYSIESDMSAAYRVETNLGEVHLRRGEVSQARDYLDQAVEAAEAVGERIVLANARILLGQLEEQTGNPRLADDHFGNAIRILEELGMPDRLRDEHMEYAEVLEGRHDLVAALRHWKQGAEIGKVAATGLTWAGTAAGAEAKGSLA